MAFPRPVKVAGGGRENPSPPSSALLRLPKSNLRALGPAWPIVPRRIHPETQRIFHGIRREALLFLEGIEPVVEMHNFGSICSADVAKLASVVRRRCNPSLSAEDHEDIVSTILLDAALASRKSGTPMVALAFTFASFPRYYSRPSARLQMETARRQAVRDEEAPDFEAPDARDFTEAVEVRDLLDHLSSELREIAVACDMDGDKLDEFATEHQVPRSTAHRRLKSARRILATAWSGN